MGTVIWFAIVQHVSSDFNDFGIIVKWIGWDFNNNNMLHSLVQEIVSYAFLWTGSSQGDSLYFLGAL